MKKLLLLVVLIQNVCLVMAQQIPQFSQYMQNHYLLNPAATGTNDQFPVYLAYRKDWVGMSESPTAQYFSGHLSVFPSMGAGIKVFNYQTGPNRKTGAELTYSYHLNLGSEMKLAFGLSGLFYQYFLDKSKLDFEEDLDAVLAGEDKMFVPDATFGTYFYGKNFYAGLSIPQLFNRNIDFKTDAIVQQEQVRHYYLLGGYIFEVNTDFTLEPALLFKFVEAGLFQADINVKAEYKKMVSLGLCYRTSDAVVIQAGYRYDQFSIGYSYDITVSDIKTASFGSHEIVLGYVFNNFFTK